MDVLESKLVKTRKKQFCWGCGKDFEKGSNLLFVKGVSPEGFCGAYWCQVCDVTMSDNKGEYPDYESDGYEYAVVKEFDGWEENKKEYPRTFSVVDIT